MPHLQAVVCPPADKYRLKSLILQVERKTIALLLHDFLCIFIFKFIQSPHTAGHAKADITSEATGVARSQTHATASKLPVTLITLSFVVD